MRLTLKQKRMIVRDFKEGMNPFFIAKQLPAAVGKLGFHTDGMAIIEVLRDYMNGKFKLTHKQKGRTG